MAHVGEDIAVKIQKLLAQAQSGHEHEAETAMRFAQALMRKHNLDWAAIKDSESTTTDAREKVRVDRSARFTYQRKLWEVLSKVNYCWYSTVSIWEEERPWTPEEEAAGRKLRTGKPLKSKKRHSILGRRSNVVMVQTMGVYLEDTMSRLTGDMRGAAVINWKNGCVDRLVERMLADFKSTDGVKGGSADDKALVLKSLSDREYAGNYDFKNGDGAWARRLAANEAYEKQRQEEEEAAEKAWLEFLANESEEDRKARQKKEERDYRRYNRPSRSTGARDSARWAAEDRKEAKKTGNAFYREGQTAGSSVSLKRQVESGQAKRLK